MDLLLGVFNIQEAKRIQATLKDESQIETALDFNGQTCTQGCTVTVELWAKSDDKLIISEFFAKESSRDLAGHSIDVEAMNQVFDSSIGSAKCQACSGEFDTSLSVCPHCGLHY